MVEICVKDDQQLKICDVSPPPPPEPIQFTLAVVTFTIPWLSAFYPCTRSSTFLLPLGQKVG